MEVRRSDEDFYTPLRLEPTVASSTKGEVANGELVDVSEQTIGDGVRWALITTDAGATGYIKLAYCTSLTRSRKSGRCVVVPQPGGGPFHGKLGPTTYRGPSVEEFDELSRCPACNDVLSDGSQCMCSA